GLAARVLWNAPEGAIRPRGHMLLRVDLGDEPYIADVGFGGQTLTGPLRLVTDIAQTTPHELYRLVEDGGNYVLQTQIRDPWKSMYRLDLQQEYPVDYEVSSWYLSNHPESRFVTSLMAARPVPGRRYALANNQLTVHELAFAGAGPERREAPQGDRRRAAGDSDRDRASGRPVPGITKHHTLRSVAELREALEIQFGVHVPADPAIDAALARLCS